jgi:N utilization substance protein B
MDETGIVERPFGRRDGRIFAVQLIYAHEAFPLTDFDKHWAGAVEALGHREEKLAFAREVAEGTVRNLFEINGLLARFLRNWSLDRVGKVALAVLREAVYELLYRKDIPPSVTINEALEIVKFFGVPEAAKFVNGVLDSVSRHLALLGSVENGGGGAKETGANGEVKNDRSTVDRCGAPFAEERENVESQDEVAQRRSRLGSGEIVEEPRTEEIEQLRSGSDCGCPEGVGYCGADEERQ